MGELPKNLRGTPSVPQYRGLWCTEHEPKTLWSIKKHDQSCNWVRVHPSRCTKPYASFARTHTHTHTHTHTRTQRNQKRCRLLSCRCCLRNKQTCDMQNIKHPGAENVALAKGDPEFQPGKGYHHNPCAFCEPKQGLFLVVGDRTDLRQT